MAAPRFSACRSHACAAAAIRRKMAATPARMPKSQAFSRTEGRNSTRPEPPTGEDAAVTSVSCQPDAASARAPFAAWTPSADERGEAPVASNQHASKQPPVPIRDGPLGCQTAAQPPPTSRANPGTPTITAYAMRTGTTFRPKKMVARTRMVATDERILTRANHLHPVTPSAFRRPELSAHE